VYKFCGSLLLLAWCWGINVYVFNRARINYIYIFEFKPQDCLTYVQIFEQALVWTIAFLVNFLFFYKMIRDDLGHNDQEADHQNYAYIFPFVLWLALLFKLGLPAVLPLLNFLARALHPLLSLLPAWCKVRLIGHKHKPSLFARAASCMGCAPHRSWRRRRPMFKSIMRVMTAPFHEVRFRDSFAADVMTSLPRVLTDFAMSSCFFLSGEFLRPRNEDIGADRAEECSERYVLNKIVVPILQLLPLWFRFLQNLRRYYDHAKQEAKVKFDSVNIDRQSTIDSASRPSIQSDSESGGATHELDGATADPEDFHSPPLSEGIEGGGGGRVVRGSKEKKEGCAARALSGGRHPHLTNGLKYALSIAVGLFPICHPFLKQVAGPIGTTTDLVFQYAWLFVFVGSTLYSWCWDCSMDWGLWRNRQCCATDKGPKPWLRDQTMYHVSVYYFAIITDLGLRFLWTLSLIPATDSSPFRSHLQMYLSPGLAALEILRRTMWACLRLENEHLNNVGRYRKVNFVPTHFENDPSPLLRSSPSLRRRAGEEAGDSGKAQSSAGNDNSSKSGTAVLTEIALFVLCLLCIAAIAVFTKRKR
jgi:hypothetical protein